MKSARIAALLLVLLSPLQGNSEPDAPIQARLLPAYAADGVSFFGIRIDRILPDSMFARIGLRDGDVITECNGIIIRDSSTAAAVLSEFANAAVLRLIVVDATGVERLLEVAVPDS